MRLLLLFSVLLVLTFTSNAQSPADSVRTIVDSSAQFPGGKEGWLKFIRTNLRYPQAAQDNEIQGEIDIQFIVDTDGSVSDVKAISGPAELRPEGVRMINFTTKWIPATLNGVPVKAYKVQPFTFHIVGH